MENKLTAFVQDLNRKSHVKNTGATELEGRLSLDEIQDLAKTHRLSVIDLPGSDLWCHNFGGYWRVLAVSCVAGQELSMNSIDALVLEDCDSPHMSENFTVFYSPKI